MAFGEDAPALWELLRRATGWWCVNVSASLAHELAAIMQRELRCSVHLYCDVYHTLARPGPSFENTAVRMLTPEDTALVEAAPAEMRGNGFRSTWAMLSDGMVAGAIISGGLAAIAFTSAMMERPADIGVATHEGFRRRDPATAAASLVIQRVRGSGRVPVWSTGEDNHASLCVARKLGFEERFRRTYVIPERG